MSNEPDLFDRLHAVALIADRLDAGTQLQLRLILERALERALDPEEANR